MENDKGTTELCSYIYNQESSKCYCVKHIFFMVSWSYVLHDFTNVISELGSHEHKLESNIIVWGYTKFTVFFIVGIITSSQLQDARKKYTKISAVEHCTERSHSPIPREYNKQEWQYATSQMEKATMCQNEVRSQKDSADCTRQKTGKSVYSCSKCREYFKLGLEGE